MFHRRLGFVPCIQSLRESGDKRIQTYPGNVLHHVIVKAVLFANPENLDDVGVVQVGGNAGLPFKSLELLLIQQHLSRQHFDRHPAPQGLLLSFENHAHSPTPNFTDEPEITQTFQSHRPERYPPVAGLGLPRLEPFCHRYGRKQFPDFFRQVGVPPSVFLKVRMLPLPQPLHVLSGQQFQGVAFCA